MKPISPVVPGKQLKEIVLAEHQDEYQNLPVVECGGGVLLSRWELTDDEKKFIAEHGYLYLWNWTFGQPLQPVVITAEEPEF